MYRCIVILISRSEVQSLENLSLMKTIYKLIMMKRLSNSLCRKFNRVKLLVSKFYVRILEEDSSIKRREAPTASHQHLQNHNFKSTKIKSSIRNPNRLALKLQQSIFRNKHRLQVPSNQYLN